MTEKMKKENEDSPNRHLSKRKLGGDQQAVEGEQVKLHQW